MDKDTIEERLKTKSSPKYAQLSEREKGQVDGLIEAAIRDSRQDQATHNRYKFARQKDNMKDIYEEMRGEFNAPRERDAPQPNLPAWSELEAKGWERTNSQMKQAEEKKLDNLEASVNRVYERSQLPDKSLTTPQKSEQRPRMKP
jgi:hypothetical protein